MIDIDQLDSLFFEYGYSLQDTNDSCRVYLLRQGMYYGAEIVIFDGSDQISLQNEYSKAGFSVKIQRFCDIGDAEEYLFQGFFKTDVSKLEIRRRYQDFAEKQVKPYGQNSDIKYKYIQMPFMVYKDTFDEGKEGVNLLNTIFEQIEKPGAHLVIVEAAAGYGKTCTSYELFNSFISRTSAKSIKPIFTELSNNRDAKQFKYVLWSEIDNEKSTNAKQSLVVYNIRKGRIPLIIDGFDELLSKEIDSGSQEGLDEFEQVETMLSTIGGLLTDEAKIILTSRKTAIFAGAEFEKWVDSYSGAFDVVRIQLDKPEIRTWLSDLRYNALVDANVPLEHISNPVLLTYLRNISDDEFQDVLQNPTAITTKYLEFLLNREKIRQHIIIPAKDQQIIFENLALSLLEFGIMGDTRQFVKDLIIDYNKSMLLQYKELSTDNPTLNELADTMVNHALLDRKGNKDYVTFVNEYIFGFLLGKTLLKSDCSFLGDQSPYPEDILDRVISSFKYEDREERRLLWEVLSPFKHRMGPRHALFLDSILINEINDSYESCAINSLTFENVVFHKDGGIFSNVSFVDCTFEKCVLSTVAFVQTIFTGCKFIGCSILDDEMPGLDNQVHFYGCDDCHTGFISSFMVGPKPIIEEKDAISLEVQILSKYFKVDGRSTKMKCVSYIKGEFPADKLEEVFSVFETLRKHNLIQVRGNNSFITQSGINYYHKHSS